MELFASTKGANLVLKRTLKSTRILWYRRGIDRSNRVTARAGNGTQIKNTETNEWQSARSTQRVSIVCSFDFFYVRFGFYFFNQVLAAGHSHSADLQMSLILKFAKKEKKNKEKDLFAMFKSLVTIFFCENMICANFLVKLSFILKRLCDTNFLWIPRHSHLLRATVSKRWNCSFELSISTGLARWPRKATQKKRR